VLNDAEVTVDLQGKKLTSMDVAADPAIAGVFNSFLDRLTAIRT
jgi:hypothetical protein